MSSKDCESSIQGHFISKMNPSQELLNIGEKSSLDSLLIKKSKPFKMGPSSVLGRVKSFLPQMEVANKQLEEKIAGGAMMEDLDIENVDDCEGPIIEMNLALCAHDENSDDEEEESEEDESDSDEDNRVGLQCDKSDLGDATLSELKLPGKGKKPKDGRTLIEVMPGEVSDDVGCNDGDKT